jgi:hypothetical protein
MLNCAKTCQVWESSPEGGNHLLLDMWSVVPVRCPGADVLTLSDGFSIHRQQGVDDPFGNCFRVWQVR